MYGRFTIRIIKNKKKVFINTNPVSEADIMIVVFIKKWVGNFA